MLLRIFTFLSLFLGFVSCHHSPTPPSITHLAERQKGMDFFEKAYQKYGDNTDSLAMANYDSAVKYFTIYLRHNPVIDTTNQSIKLKLGYAYTQLERLNEADSCFSNLSPRQFEHNYWYGNYLYKKTDYQKAYTTFKSLENHPFIQQDSNWKAQLCMDIANSKCEFELFSYTDSIEVVSYFKKAYQIASKRYLQLKSIYNLGVFWGERGDLIREDSCLTFASNAYDKEGILPPESFYLNCSYDAPPNKAKVYLQKEINYHKKRNHKIGMAIGYGMLAVLWRDNLSQHRYHLDTALYYYKKANNLFLPTPPNLYESQYLDKYPSIETFIYRIEGLARTYRFKYLATRNQTYLDTSLNYFKSVIYLSQNIRKQLGAEKSKQILTSNHYQIYEPALNATYTLYQQPNYQDTALQLAYQFIEAGKSLNLLETIHNKSALASSGISQDTLDLEQQLQTEILNLDNRLQRKNEAGLWEEKQRLEQQLSQVLAQLEKHHPRYYQLKYPNTQLTINQIQQKCKKDNCTFIDFFQGEYELYALYISPTQKGLLKKEIDNNSLDTLTHHFTAQIDSLKSYNNIKQYISTSQNLYQAVFKELDSLIFQTKGQKVTLVLDGHLHKISFDGLISQTSPTEYLLQKYNFSYFPSAYLWLTSDTTSVQDPNIGLFAPIFDATFYQHYTQSPDKLETDLDEALKMVNALKSHYPLTAYLREQSTKSLFQSKAIEYDVLHIATHAIGNDSMPDKSFLALTPNTLNDSVQKGHLFLNDIYATKMKSELALLTACETHKGAVLKGEGVMSLARGFRYAGCERMITTLWAVKAEEVSPITTSFYKFLSQGYSYGDALYKAKLERFNPKYPNHWAGIILIGDATAKCKIPINTNNTFTNKYLYIILLTVLILTVLIFFLIRKKLKIF